MPAWTSLSSFSIDLRMALNFQSSTPLPNDFIELSFPSLLNAELLTSCWYAPEMVRTPRYRTKFLRVPGENKIRLYLNPMDSDLEALVRPPLRPDSDINGHRSIICSGFTGGPEQNTGSVDYYPIVNYYGGKNNVNLAGYYLPTRLYSLPWFPPTVSSEVRSAPLGAVHTVVFTFICAQAMLQPIMRVQTPHIEHTGLAFLGSPVCTAALDQSDAPISNIITSSYAFTVDLHTVAIAGNPTASLVVTCKFRFTGAFGFTPKTLSFDLNARLSPQNGGDNDVVISVPLSVTSRAEIGATPIAATLSPAPLFDVPVQLTVTASIKRTYLIDALPVLALSVSPSRLMPLNAICTLKVNDIVLITSEELKLDAYALFGMKPSLIGQVPTAGEYVSLEIQCSAVTIPSTVNEHVMPVVTLRVLPAITFSSGVDLQAYEVERTLAVIPYPTVSASPSLLSTRVFADKNGDFIFNVEISIPALTTDLYIVDIVTITVVPQSTRDYGTFKRVDVQNPVRMCVVMSTATGERFRTATPLGSSYVLSEPVPTAITFALADDIPKGTALTVLCPQSLEKTRDNTADVTRGTLRTNIVTFAVTRSTTSMLIYTSFKAAEPQPASNFALINTIQFLHDQVGYSNVFNALYHNPSQINAQLAPLQPLSVRVSATVSWFDQYNSVPVCSLLINSHEIVSVSVSILSDKSLQIFGINNAAPHVEEVLQYQWYDIYTGCAIRVRCSGIVLLTAPSQIPQFSLDTLLPAVSTGVFEKITVVRSITTAPRMYMNIASLALRKVTLSTVLPFPALFGLHLGSLGIELINAGTAPFLSCKYNTFAGTTSTNVAVLPILGPLITIPLAAFIEAASDLYKDAAIVLHCTLSNNVNISATGIVTLRSFVSPTTAVTSTFKSIDGPTGARNVYILRDSNYAGTGEPLRAIMTSLPTFSGSNGAFTTTILLDIGLPLSLMSPTGSSCTVTIYDADYNVVAEHSQTNAVTSINYANITFPGAVIGGHVALTFTVHLFNGDYESRTTSATITASLSYTYVTGGATTVAHMPVVSRVIPARDTIPAQSTGCPARLAPQLPYVKRTSVTDFVIKPPVLAALSGVAVGDTGVTTLSNTDQVEIDVVSNSVTLILCMYAGNDTSYSIASFGSVSGTVTNVKLTIGALIPQENSLTVRCTATGTSSTMSHGIAPLSMKIGRYVASSFMYNLASYTNGCYKNTLDIGAYDANRPFKARIRILPVGSSLEINADLPVKLFQTSADYWQFYFAEGVYATSFSLCTMTQEDPYEVLFEYPSCSAQVFPDNKTLRISTGTPSISRPYTPYVRWTTKVTLTLTTVSPSPAARPFVTAPSIGFASNEGNVFLNANVDLLSVDLLIDTSVSIWTYSNTVNTITGFKVTTLLDAVALPAASQTRQYTARYTFPANRELQSYIASRCSLSVNAVDYTFVSVPALQFTFALQDVVTVDFELLSDAGPTTGSITIVLTCDTGMALPVAIGSAVVDVSILAKPTVVDGDSVTLQGQGVTSTTALPTQLSVTNPQLSDPGNSRNSNFSFVIDMTGRNGISIDDVLMLTVDAHISSLFTVLVTASSGTLSTSDTATGSQMPFSAAVKFNTAHHFSTGTLLLVTGVRVANPPVSAASFVITAGLFDRNGDVIATSTQLTYNLMHATLTPSASISQYVAHNSGTLSVTTLVHSNLYSGDQLQFLMHSPALMQAPSTCSIELNGTTLASTIAIIATGPMNNDLFYPRLLIAVTMQSDYGVASTPALHFVLIICNSFIAPPEYNGSGQNLARLVNGAGVELATTTFDYGSPISPMVSESIVKSGSSVHGASTGVLTAVSIASSTFFRNSDTVSLGPTSLFTDTVGDCACVPVGATVITPVTGQTLEWTLSGITATGATFSIFCPCAKNPVVDAFATVTVVVKTLYSGVIARSDGVYAIAPSSLGAFIVQNTLSTTIIGQQSSIEFMFVDSTTYADSDATFEMPSLHTDMEPLTDFECEFTGTDLIGRAITHALMATLTTATGFNATIPRLTPSTVRTTFSLQGATITCSQLQNPPLTTPGANFTVLLLDRDSHDAILTGFTTLPPMTLPPPLLSTVNGELHFVNAIEGVTSGFSISLVLDPFSFPALTTESVYVGSIPLPADFEPITNPSQCDAVLSPLSGFTLTQPTSSIDSVTRMLTFSFNAYALMDTTNSRPMVVISCVAAVMVPLIITSLSFSVSLVVTPDIPATPAWVLSGGVTTGPTLAVKPTPTLVPSYLWRNDSGRTASFALQFQALPIALEQGASVLISSAVLFASPDFNCNASSHGIALAPLSVATTSDPTSDLTTAANAVSTITLGSTPSTTVPVGTVLTVTCSGTVNPSAVTFTGAYTHVVVLNAPNNVALTHDTIANFGQIAPVTLTGSLTFSPALLNMRTLFTLKALIDTILQPGDTLSMSLPAFGSVSAADATDCTIAYNNGAAAPATVGAASNVGTLVLTVALNAAPSDVDHNEIVLSCNLTSPRIMPLPSTATVTISNVYEQIVSSADLDYVLTAQPILVVATPALPILNVENILTLLLEIEFFDGDQIILHSNEATLTSCYSMTSGVTVTMTGSIAALALAQPINSIHSVTIVCQPVTIAPPIVPNANASVTVSLLDYNDSQVSTGAGSFAVQAEYTGVFIDAAISSPFVYDTSHVSLTITGSDFALLAGNEFRIAGFPAGMTLNAGASCTLSPGSLTMLATLSAGTLSMALPDPTGTVSTVTSGSVLECSSFTNPSGPLPASSLRFTAVSGAITMLTAGALLPAIESGDIAEFAELTFADSRTYANTTMSINFTMPSSLLMSTDIEVYVLLPEVYSFSAPSIDCTATADNMTVFGSTTQPALAPAPFRVGFKPIAPLPTITAAPFRVVISCTAMNNARGVSALPSKARISFVNTLSGFDPTLYNATFGFIPLPSVISRLMGQHAATLTLANALPGAVTSVILSLNVIADEISVWPGESIVFGLPAEFKVAAGGMTECIMKHNGAIVNGTTQVSKAYRRIQFMLQSPAAYTSPADESVITCDHILNPPSETAAVSDLTAAVMTSEANLIAVTSTMPLAAVKPTALGLDGNDMVAVRNVNGQYQYNVRVSPMNWNFTAGMALRFDWPTSEVVLTAGANCRVVFGSTTPYTMSATTSIDIAHTLVLVILRGSYVQVPAAASDVMNVWCTPVSAVTGNIGVKIYDGVTVQGIDPASGIIYAQSVSAVKGSLSPPSSLINPWSALLDWTAKLVTTPVVIFDSIGNLIMNFYSDTTVSPGTAVTLFAPLQEKLANNATLECLVNGMLVETRRNTAATSEFTLVLGEGLFYIPNQAMNISCTVNTEIIMLIPIRITDSVGVTVPITPNPAVAELAQMGEYELLFYYNTTTLRMPSPMVITVQALNTILSPGDYMLINLPDGFDTSENTVCSVLMTYEYAAGAVTNPESFTTQLQGATLKLIFEGDSNSFNATSFVGAPVITRQWEATGTLRPAYGGALAADGYIGSTWFAGDVVSTEIACTNIMRTSLARVPYSDSPTQQAIGAYVSNTLVARGSADAVTMNVPPIAAILSATTSSFILSGTTTPVTAYSSMGLSVFMQNITVSPIAGDVLHFMPSTPASGTPWDLSSPALQCTVRVDLDLVQNLPIAAFAIFDSTTGGIAVTIPAGVSATPSIPPGQVDMTLLCAPVHAPSVAVAATVIGTSSWQLVDSLNRLVVSSAANSAVEPEIVVASLTDTIGVLVFPFTASPIARLYTMFTLNASQSEEATLHLPISVAFPITLPAQGFECSIDEAPPTTATIAGTMLQLTFNSVLVAGVNHTVRCGEFATVNGATETSINPATITVGGIITATTSSGLFISGSFDPSVLIALTIVSLGNAQPDSHGTITIDINIPFTLPSGGDITVTMPSIAWDLTNLSTCNITSLGITTSAAVTTLLALSTFTVVLPASITGAMELSCDHMRTPAAEYTSADLEILFHYSAIPLVTASVPIKPLLLSYSVAIPLLTPSSAPLAPYELVASFLITAYRTAVLSGSQRDTLLLNLNAVVHNALIKSVHVHRQWRLGSHKVVVQVIVRPEYGPTMLPGSVAPLLASMIPIMFKLRVTSPVKLAGTLGIVTDPVELPIPLTCTDGDLNDKETDIDCGGHTCRGCEDSNVCGAGRDCMSTLCNSGSCQYPLNGISAASINPVNLNMIVAMTLLAVIVGFMWVTHEQQQLQ